MKFKVLCIALIGIFILGFSIISAGSQTQPNTLNNLRIISSNTNLKVGDLGFIKIQGKPGTRYNIRTVFQNEKGNVSIAQMRVTDASGQTTFNWVVENGTQPGKNTATITGNGESISITHTVIK